MTMALQTSYLETPAIAFAGQLGGGPSVTLPGKNAEASASIPFGRAVAFKPSGATSDVDCTVVANSTDKIKGILYRSDSYARAWTDENGVHGELDSTGVTAGSMMDLLCEGMIYVPCVTGCVPSERLYISYNATGSVYTAAGTLGNAAESSHTIDCTGQGEWLSTAAANGLAWLKVNFTALAT